MDGFLRLAQLSLRSSLKSDSGFSIGNKVEYRGCGECAVLTKGGQACLIDWD